MKKFDKRYIYYHLIVDFLAILVFSIWAFYSLHDEEEYVFQTVDLWSIAVIFLILYIVKTIYSVLYYRTSGYELCEKEIKCKRGVFFRKKSILEYSRMHAINKKQGLIQRLFGIAVLTIDSGSTNTAFSAEITVIERNEIVDKLLAEVKKRQLGDFSSENENPEGIISEKIDKKRENLYSFTPKRKFIYSALNVACSLIVVLVVSIVAALIFGLLTPYIDFELLTDTTSVIMTTLAVFALILVGVALICFVSSIIASFFNYYNFCIYKTDRDIEIDYGFFVKNTNTFKLDKIKGVVITQGIVRRLFGFASVNLEVVGYRQSDDGKNSNTSNGVGVLMPLCAARELEQALGNILPDYLPENRDVRSGFYLPFVMWGIFYLSVFWYIPTLILVFNLALFGVAFGIILSFLLISVACSLPFYLLILVNGKFEFDNSGIKISRDKLTVFSGGLIKRTTIIKRENIVAMEDITTPLRAKKGVYSFNIHFYSNAATNVVKVKNLDVSVIEELRNTVNA